MNEYNVLDILMVLFSTQIVNTYLVAFRNHKKTSSLISMGAWGAYVFFQLWVMLSNASQPLFILTVNILLVFLIYKSSYHVNNKTALFFSSFFYAIWMMVEVATNNLLQLTNLETDIYFFVLGSAVSKIVMYIIVHLFKRYRKSDSFLDIPLHYWFRLSLIPVATFYIIHNTYCLTSATSSDNVFFTITTILMILVNYITFDVYDKLGNYLYTEKNNYLYKQQIALCNKQAAERENAYQNTRRIRHDLNEYLIDLKTAIQAGNSSEAESKINYILNQNKIYINETSHSGNLVIDSLINYKYSLAQKEGINMKCNVAVPELLPFDGADICIILGNLIDNAMAAIKTLPLSSRRIDISISQIKGSLSIIVQNPYEGTIRKKVTGHIMTSKKDSSNHGIGLASIQRSVDKYNGDLVINHDNKMFIVNILLYPLENLHTES